MRKKIFLFLNLLFIFLAIFKIANFKKEDITIASKTVYLANLDDGVEEDVEKLLDDLDLTNLNDIVNNLDKEQKKVINSSSFIEIVKNFIYSTNFSSFGDFLKYLLNLIFKNVVEVLPFFIIIFIVAIFQGIIEESSFLKEKGTKNIVFLVCICLISGIVLKIIFGSLKGVTSAINSIANMLELLFPIILTLIASLGGTNTASVFQPALAIFSNVIVKIFTAVLIPLFIFVTVFNIVGNLSTNIKLEKFSKFLGSLFKSIIGIIFTIFIAFLTIQGLTSSTIDGVSIKTAKFALKNYIPILGSYLSDGVSVMLLSAGIIKNAVGVAGLIIIIFLIISPIIKVLLISLMFKLLSGILEVVSGKVSKFLYDVSNGLSMLIICLIALGLMAIISISILLSVSNIF